ncbi:hypothetical protein WH47_03590 [Habropoda laboriosa]|uniref:Uncharacterized protein n=1 Tax=Habropoda laboriosa TaxID=597456 RepID=A0A0L7RIB5_9HYME|nr:hypothetical protein WH47_03590 [Habropoda laboriosa]
MGRLLIQTRKDKVLADITGGSNMVVPLNGGRTLSGVQSSICSFTRSYFIVAPFRSRATRHHVD